MDENRTKGTKTQKISYFYLCLIQNCGYDQKDGLKLGFIFQGHLQFPLPRHFSPTNCFVLASPPQLFLPLSFPPFILLFLPSFQRFLGPLQIFIHFNHHRLRFRTFSAVQPILLWFLPFPLEFSQQLRQRLILQPFQSTQFLSLHRAFPLPFPLRRHLIFLWLQEIYPGLQFLFLPELPPLLPP